MKGAQSSQENQNLAILENLDSLVESTTNTSALIDAATDISIIAQDEKNVILNHFPKEDDQLRVFYILLNSKACTAPDILNLLSSTGNQGAASILEDDSSCISGGESNECDEWISLQKNITDNIDRLSSQTRNLGLVLCFSSGIGLITGKDRETIANYSTLEIDQLKKFYLTVSGKEQDAYEKLLKVLKMTNNNWALSVLQIGE